MKTNFDNIFKQISLLARMQLEGIGLKLNPLEELDYFCFCLITALSKETGHHTEYFDLRFMSLMQQKYDLYNAATFQLRQDVYQYYLTLALHRRTTPTGADPIMQIAYVLSDQSVDPQFHRNMNIILLNMTIRHIIQHSRQHIQSVTIYSEATKKPD
ncbi:MAG: hypothetical protein LKF82_06655 [Acinetobacter populi]|jgi:hypothetical protein|uniref:hypothetical protein n=1 Tax=Acinetobacter populi TaxID=1582270 RepID=UPI0023552CDB|nr:hypothetical protein [Acinetobacter populi]MCH4247504.1 hypothetical protein [Acinetobacter populi]